MTRRERTGGKLTGNAKVTGQVPLPATAPGLLVECREVSRVFGDGPSAVVAVHGSSCHVAAGARIAVVGPSGSGKSTLLHLMAGLEKPTAGRVSWPALTQDSTEDRLHGLAPAFQIGVVFQSPSLVPALNAIENTALPLVLGGTEAREADERAAQALAAVGLGAVQEKLPEELSGGQAQRVAAARVLAQRPRLVLADEPTGQLDHITGQHLLDVILQTVDTIGAGLVVSTHDPSVAERLNTSWRMDHGRLRVPKPRSAEQVRS